MLFQCFREHAHPDCFQVYLQLTCSDIAALPSSDLQQFQLAFIKGKP